MKLNPDNPTPLYIQLKEELIQLIKNGTFSHGAKIPTEVELSGQFNVSRITVRRAVDELCKEGLLEKKQGKGTFVQAQKIQRKIEHLLSFSEACRTNGMSPSTIVTKREYICLDETDAKEMKETPGSRAVYIQRVRMADGIPIMCENNYYPYPKYDFLMEESLDGSLYRLLDEKYHIHVCISTNSYLDIVRARGELTSLLRVSVGEPLFFLYTQMYDSQETLVHIGRQYILSDRYRFYLADYREG